MALINTCLLCVSLYWSFCFCFCCGWVNIIILSGLAILLAPLEFLKELFLCWDVSHWAHTPEPTMKQSAVTATANKIHANSNFESWNKGFLLSFLTLFPFCDLSGLHEMWLINLPSPYFPWIHSPIIYLVCWSFSVMYVLPWADILFNLLVIYWVNSDLH